MKPLRVVHVLHSFGIGGLEKGIATLARHGSADIEHVVLCLARSGVTQDLLPAGTRVLALGKQEGNSFRFMAALAREICRLQPDVVHTRNWGGMDAIIAARMAGIDRIVHGEHGWGMEDPQGLSRRRIWIRRVLCLGVRELTCVSLQIKDWLENTVRVRRPVTQIYNGLDFDLFNPGHEATNSLRQELGISREKFLIGSVGRLDPIKDMRGLLSAFSALRRKNPECCLVLVGDGPEMSQLQSIKGSGVYLLGERRDIPQILRSLDLYIQASLNEGVSNTLLEAMGCGLPIVTTAVGGNPELIQQGRNGFLCAPRDYSAMTGYLELYLQTPELRRLHGEQGRRLAVGRFSNETMTKGYETVWKRVAGRKI